MAILECPSCHKSIDVPEHKLGRWIACPICKMEFAALPDRNGEEEETQDEFDSHDEFLPSGPKISWRLALPVGLLLLVGVTGILVYVVAKQSSGGAGAKSQRIETVSPDSMPTATRRVQSESPLDIPGLSPGSLDGALGLGSSIRSFIWWTTVLSVLFLLSSVGMLVWMARDSRNRGMESVASWITPVLLTNVLAFLVYLMSRPQGHLVHCRRCNNRCLENAQSCPHCRRTKPTRKKRSRLDD